MLKLSELKISPAPWRINDHASVLDRYFEIISGQYGPYNWHNASLIAAAPELYEGGYAVIFGKCKKCFWCNRNPANKCEFDGKCSVKNLRAALAKAAGESEVTPAMMG